MFNNDPIREEYFDMVGLVEEDIKPLSEQQFEKYTKLLGKILFPDEWSFSKVMWRMSGGSRTKALNLARNVLKHYTFPQEMTEQDFEDMFDQACADVNSGLEVEWNTE